MPDGQSAFVVGGAICAVGQILIDRTKLTPARILVGYVVIGAAIITRHERQEYLLFFRLTSPISIYRLTAIFALRIPL
ncbi:MAG: SpoVA/SpoVAEb family sporulation membrane protein [Clostridia bacterium]|nr:SpoVA/SpoVAEb family sporulation membrane protein [Clostridia bacterium]